jgi:hypothetical protein
MRRAARQAVEVGDRDHAGGAGRIHRLDAGVEQLHGHRHVARVGRDAGLALADDGMLARVAADGRTAAARIALVAGLVGVVEVGAAGALQQVAGGGRLVAQLAGGARQQRARQHGVVAPYAFVGRQVGIAHQRAHAQAALRRRFDPVQLQTVDVDQVGGVSISSFIRSSKLVPPAMKRGRLARRQRCRFGRIARAFVSESLHALPPTSVIASMMFE